MASLTTQEPPSDLDKVLQDSKATLETEAKAKGRGRPKGSTSSSALSKPSAVTKVDPSTYKQMLSSVIQFTGDFLATGSKFEGFKFSKDELDLLATQGAEVCAEFMPVVESKYVKLGMFTLSVCTIYGTKYYAFNQHEQKRLQTIKDQRVKEETSIKQEIAPINLMRGTPNEVQAN